MITGSKNIGSPKVEKSIKGLSIAIVWSIVTGFMVLFPSIDNPSANAAISGFTFKAIAAGDYHSLAIGSNGHLYAWGSNSTGQLGDGTTTDRLTPVEVSRTLTGSLTFSAIAAGDAWNLALASDGRLFSWGLNNNGQLGDGSSITRKEPVLVNTALTFSKIAAGSGHALAIAADGHLYSWGYNGQGSLGINTQVNKNVPVAVSTTLTGVLTFSSVAAAAHSLALASDGTLYSWGSNGNGQLGDGTTTNRLEPVAVSGAATFSSIAAGAGHSHALTSDGNAYSWGFNYSGLLGDGTTTDRHIPTQVATAVTFSQLTAGRFHSAAIRSDGFLMAWGYNGVNQVGDGTTTARTTPVFVSTQSSQAATFSQLAAGPGVNSFFSLALGLDGKVYGWGYNAYGQLGDGTTTVGPYPTAVSFNPPLDNVYGDGNCGLLDDYVLGLNTLGVGSAADPFQISSSEQLWEVGDCDGDNGSSIGTRYFSLIADIEATEAVTGTPTSSPISDLTYGELNGNGHKISFSMYASPVDDPLGLGLFQALNDSTVSNLILAANILHLARTGEFSVGALSNYTSGDVFLTNLRTEGSVFSSNVDAGGLVGYGIGSLVLYSVSNHVQVSSVTGNAGGLFGTFAGSDVTATYVRNFGNITSNEIAGGLVGQNWAEATMLFKAENSAAIFGGAAGGLLGSFKRNPESATISESLNRGSVLASHFAGGLIGFSDASDSLILSIENSANYGTVSATAAPSNASGIIGKVDTLTSDLEITLANVLSTGSIEGGTSVDGLLNFGSLEVALATWSPSLDSVNSKTESQYLGANADSLLKQVSTYPTWDFTNIWGMPSCSVNNGYPVLRWLYPNETFYDLSCGVNAAPVVTPSAPTAPSSPAASSPQPYKGPTVTSPRTVVYLGQVVELEGYKLDEVTEAYVMDVQIQIVSSSPTSIVLAISTSTELGVQDLIFVSSYGRLTTIGALDVRQITHSESTSHELLGFAWTLKFVGNSRDLTPAQVAKALDSMANFPTATTIVCWGYTTAYEPNDWAIAHATKRASSACDLVAENYPDIKVAVRLRFGAPKSAAMRASLQFWQATTTR